MSLPGRDCAFVVLTVFWLTAATVGAQDCSQEKLRSGMPLADAFFGQAVSVSGDVAVVGAPRDTSLGAAHVYRKVGQVWTEEARLTASDAGAGDEFGTSVSVSDDVILVGAEGHDGLAVRAGAAYVFRHDGTDWIEEQILTASNGARNDNFGHHVSLVAGLAVVGTAVGTSPLSTGSGEAYVFRHDGSRWQQEARLASPIPAPDDLFGQSVSVSGDVVLVAARGDNEAGSRSGAVHVFRFDGTAWAAEAKLIPQFPQTNAELGSSVSVQGGLAVIGSKSFLGSGAVHVFRHDGTDWAEEARFRGNDSARGDHFGVSVSLSGAQVLVGAAKHSHGGSSEAGAAYVFGHDGCGWAQLLKLTADDAESGDDFGASVSLTAGTAFVGARFSDDVEDESGSAYALDCAAEPCRSNADCDDGDVCTDDSCTFSSGVCSYVPAAIGTPCDDGLACTLDDGCDGSLPPCAACVGTLVDCDDGNLCTSDSCEASSGVCLNTQVDCDDRDGCTTDSCDLSDGECLNAPIVCLSCPEQEVHPLGASEGNAFGSAVSISGDAALIGSPFDTDPVFDAGSASIFRNDGTGWTEEAKLTSDDLAWNDRFGHSVSLSGDLALVGAYGSDRGGNWAGQAYLFRHDGTSWPQEAVLAPGDPREQAIFGYGVSVDGDLALVGAPATLATMAGTAYVFRRIGAAWIEEARLEPGDTAPWNQFGRAVAISGDVAVVGAWQDDGVAPDAGAVYVFRHDGLSWNEESKLTASDAVDGDRLGASVALAGNRILAGAPGTLPFFAAVPGSAYVFSHDGLSWTEETKLTASDGAAYDAFGASVALLPDRLVVGAVGENNREGATYLFRHDGSDWTEGAKILASDARAADGFGTSVALALDVTLVGAPATDDDGNGSGSAYFFDCPKSCASAADCDDGKVCTEDSCDPVSATCHNTASALGLPCDDGLPCTTNDECDGARTCLGLPKDCDDGFDCTLDECDALTGTCGSTPLACVDCVSQKLLPADAQAADSAGSSVALAGPVALVGSRFDDDAGSASGSVTVFRHDGSTWLEEAKLLAADGMAGDFFGWSLSLSGDVALVGARGVATGGAGAGAAYVFRHDGATWLEEAKLLAGDPAPSDRLGWSVSVDGDLAVIGAPNDDDRGADSGSAYVFRFDGATWSQEAKLIGVDTTGGDEFGIAVSLSGDRLAVGAHQDNDGGTNAGSVYFFHHDGASWVQTTKLLASDAGAEDGFGISVAVDGLRALVGSAGDDDLGPESGAVYAFAFDGTTWGGESKLVADDTAPGDGLGVSVSLSGDVALIGAAGNDDGGDDSGSAYTFRDDGMAWVQERKLVANAASPFDAYGFSVAVSGEFALVGAHGDDEAGAAAGAAYVHDCTPQPCLTDIDCDDSLPCTDDVCDVPTGECSSAPSMMGLACDDGDACTMDDTCDGMAACQGAPVDCDDGLPCTDDVCEAATGECAHSLKPAGGACDDGDGCTDGDTCDGGFTCLGTLRDCDDGVECTDDLCNPATGLCENPQSADGSPCDDGDPCTDEDDCDAAGACEGVLVTDCDDGLRCTDDSCEPAGGGCIHRPVALGTDCDDGSFCIFNEVCDGFGACVGQEVDCDDGIECTFDTCEEPAGTCAHLEIGCEQCPEQKVTEPDGRAGWRFGSSVDVHGDAAIVGSPTDNSGTSIGSADVFRRIDGEWVAEASLSGSDSANGDDFGWNVSLSGDVAIVGAHSKADPGPGVGAAYVFRHDGSDWTEEAKLVPGDVAPVIWFGSSVSISGDVAVVGASLDSEVDHQVGAAYVFRRDGSDWLEEAKLLPSDPVVDGRFGYAVSIEEDVALVGSTNGNPAYIYRFDGSTWDEEAVLDPEDASPLGLGGGVELSGDTAIIGAFRDSAAVSVGGAAYVYRYDGDGWLLEARLTSPEPEPSAYFGFDVSLSGDRAIVGAHGEGDAGAAYVFRRVGSTWLEEYEFPWGDATPFDEIGSSVAAWDQTLLIGARGDDDRGFQAGAAYFLDCARDTLCSIPEISPPFLDRTRGAFLVGRDGPNLSMRWQETRHDVGIYMGNLDSLRGPTGYDHEATSACRLQGSEGLLTDATPPRAYFLVVGAGCELPRVEGTTGSDSLDRERPPSESLGLPVCP